MTLKLHHLRPAPGAKTAKTRVGRGEASKGKTAGRGTKGTKARYQVPASFEGGQMPIHMRLPKLKGFKNPFKVEFQVVNLDRVNELFPEGGTVGVDEGATGVAGIDGGVGLDEPFEWAVRTGKAAIDRRDHADTDRALEAIGIADGDDELPDAETPAIR